MGKVFIVYLIAMRIKNFCAIRVINEIGKEVKNFINAFKTYLEV